LYDIIKIGFVEIYLILEENMEETISLRELFETLRKRISLIISITVLAVTLSGTVSYFLLQPIYKASTQILVSQAAAGALASIAGLSFDADAKYIETYNVIMKSPYILDQVINELDLDTTPEKLNGSINVVQEGKSQVVTISVEHSEPAKAVLIANEIAKVFQREISALMRIDNIHILSPAELPENPVPVKPQPLLNMAIALVVGLMTSVGIAFLLEYLDNTIKSEQDVEKLLELPVLGAVTTITSTEEKQKGTSRMSKTRGETVDI
jgi:capsular polysaccharide biosynthesis protein